MSVEVLCDLRSSFGPARDQGQRPTCLAFAASDAHAACRGPWAALSCEFAFYHAQRRAGRSPSLGASLPYLLEAIQGDGQPVEPDWPYFDALPTNLDTYGPPSNIVVFRRASDTRSGGVDDLISMLDANQPVLTLMMISDSFYTPGSNGVVTAPAQEQPDPMRRHAIVAVGHGRIGQNRAVLVRNSWGQDWGLDGYAWLPEPFLAPRLTRVALMTEDVDVSATNLAA